jgi:hypothetical protein
MKKNITPCLLSIALSLTLTTAAIAKQTAGDTAGEAISGVGVAAAASLYEATPEAAPETTIRWADQINDAGKASAESTPEEAAAGTEPTSILTGGAERPTEENIDSSGGEYAGGEGGMDNVYRSPEEEEAAEEGAQNGGVNSDADLAQSTDENYSNKPTAEEEQDPDEFDDFVNPVDPEAGEDITGNMNKDYFSNNTSSSSGESSTENMMSETEGATEEMANSGAAAETESTFEGLEAGGPMPEGSDSVVTEGETAAENELGMTSSEDYDVNAAADDTEEAADDSEEMVEVMM